MQKRGVFFTFSVIFILILMPNAFSVYGESVYSGTVEDGDSVNISGHIFGFRIDSVSSKVYVEIDISGIIIANGECKAKEGFDICVKNVSSTFKRDNITGLIIYKALLDVSQIKSRLDVTNTIEQNNLLIGEETIAELAIENTADVVAEGVIATINIPPSISVTDAEGCKKIFDNLVFEGNVHPTQIRKCTYKIKGLSPGDFELKANISFFDGIEQISELSNTLTIGVYNYSLRISPKLNKSKFNIQEKFNLTVDIENINDQYDLTVTIFNIKIPEKLLLIKKPKDTSGNDRIISWSGSLESGEKKSFVIGFQSQKTGNHSIPIEASYKISTFMRTVKNNPYVEVYCDCPYINSDFSQQIVAPDQRVTLKSILVNPSPIHHFRNVKFSYITNVPNIQNFSRVYSDIKPYESIAIFNSPITAPQLGEVYHFNITAIYESAASQIFVVKDKIIIKIPEEEIPIVEEKTGVEEQQETEEQQKDEEVVLGAEKSEEESEEEKEEKPVDEEIPVETIEYEEKNPITAYTIIAYIVALIFISIILIIFKRKRSEAAEKQGDINEVSSAGEKKQIITESLSNFFRKIKEKIKRKHQEDKKESDYNDLEREINALGHILEKKKGRK